MEITTSSLRECLKWHVFKKKTGGWISVCENCFLQYLTDEAINLDSKFMTETREMQNEAILDMVL